MSVTCAANCSPDAALTVTVAGWPTLTEPMSDSLSETSILKRLICASVMKLEQPDALEELDRAAAAEAAGDAVPLSCSRTTRTRTTDDEPAPTVCRPTR